MNSLTERGPVITGLSGNEIYCLEKIGLEPGDIVLGNSVVSLGVVGGLVSGIQSFTGGEIVPVTTQIADGRRNALEDLKQARDKIGALGVTDVTSNLQVRGGNVEFVSFGSSLHSKDYSAQLSSFTSSSDSQEHYLQIDANYQPKEFVFGNVAYALGVPSGISGGLKSLTRGEVPEYTEVFTKIRSLSLERIVREAKQAKANAVLGIRTTVLTISGVQEMVMIGTAATNPVLPASASIEPVSSDMTGTELWNMTKMGHIPLRLLLGTSVYSLGVTGGISAAIKSLGRGEISELTTLLYDARESALSKVQSEAKAIGADIVVGTKTYIHDLGGSLIELLAIGTAVKEVGSQINTRSESLLLQAIIRDRETFIDDTGAYTTVDLNQAGLLSPRGASSSD